MDSGYPAVADDIGNLMSMVMAFVAPSIMQALIEDILHARRGRGGTGP